MDWDGSDGAADGMVTAGMITGGMAAGMEDGIAAWLWSLMGSSSLEKHAASERRGLDHEVGA